MKKELLAQRLAPYAIVVIVILVSATGYSLYNRWRNSSHLRSVGEDFHVLETALNQYKSSKGHYPDNVPAGATPAGMSQYANYFKSSTPIGGQYDWEGPDSWGFAGIAIKKPKLSIAELTKLDKEIDNGKLYTGKFRLINNSYFWIIEEGAKEN